MLVRKLQGIDISCIISVIDKRKDSSLDFYMSALEKIAKYCFEKDITQIVIARLDSRKNYQKNIVAMFATYSIQAAFSNPSAEKALQVADFYSWSVFSHLELHNPEYFLKLKDTITII